MKHVAHALLALVIVGCGTTPATSPTASVPSPGPTVAISPTAPASDAGVQVDELRAAAFGEATVETVTGVLANAGIATYRSADSPEPLVPVSEPASPLALLHDQVRAMALEAWAGGGIPASLIDPLLPVEEDLAPPSYIVAGYVAAVDTPGATFSRALMDEQDLSAAPTLVFPQLVMALFTADVVRERSDGDGARRGDPFALRPNQPAAQRPLALAGGLLVAQSGPCSLVSDFISQALTRVFDGLKLGDRGGGGIGAILKTIWNWVVSVLQTVVTGIVREFEERVLNLIGRAAAVVGTIAVIVTAVRPWTVTVSPEPWTTEKGISGIRPTEEGALVARVDFGGRDEWPDWAEDCAQRADRPLPNLKPEGTPVSWEPLQQSPADLVLAATGQDRLDANGSARLPYTTLTDQVEDPYQTLGGTILVRVSLERQSIRDLAKIAEDEVLGELPPRVRNALWEPFLKPVLDDVLRDLSKLIAVYSSGGAGVAYHVQQATPPPDPTPTPPPATPDAKAQFCDRYVALLRWWVSHMGTDYELTRPWAAEIVRRAQEMRPFAPSELLTHVDLVIRVYGTYAIGDEFTRVPIVGPDAAQLVSAAVAMDAYCGIRRGEPPYEDLR